MIHDRIFIWSRTDYIEWHLNDRSLKNLSSFFFIKNKSRHCAIQDNLDDSEAKLWSIHQRLYCGLMVLSISY